MEWVITGTFCVTWAVTTILLGFKAQDSELDSLRREVKVLKASARVDYDRVSLQFGAVQAKFRDTNATEITHCLPRQKTDDLANGFEITWHACAFESMLLTQLLERNGYRVKEDGDGWLTVTKGETTI